MNLPINHRPEYAEAVEKLLSADLNGCGAYHKYVEVKATRDIHIHNSGIANEIYVRKSSSHTRVRSGEALPVDINNFMQSYEVCIQLTEWLERELHKHWYSSEFDEREQRLKRPPPPPH